ncbi:MAG: hypothetical protein GF388_01130 [Candidatus Aegiribacteria sp.]|nr:hypothetical protein [Candidatus Aegiribacteria sp.]
MKALFFASMSLLLICLSCSNPSGNGGQEPETVFTDTFTAADSTFPSQYTWTGDPRGNAEFLIFDNQFTHISGTHVHYFRHESSQGSGIYEFDAADSYWGFAWRIPQADPDSGNCMRLYHRSIGSGWGFVLTSFQWSTLSGYQSGQYMWHNGSHLDSDTVLTGQLSGLHHIRIEDQAGSIKVYADGDQIFDVEFGYDFDGMVGVGSDGGGSMTPAFDNVSYSTF